MGAGGLIILVFAAAVGAVLVVIGGPLVFVPVPILIAGGVVIFLQVYRRREAAQSMLKLRQEADTQKTDFTERDRETQV